MAKRPYVICHMMASIDGRIDSAVTSVANAGKYEATGQALDGDAWVCGRTTMQKHFADRVAASGTGAPAGPRRFLSRERPSPTPSPWIPPESSSGPAGTSTATT